MPDGSTHQYLRSSGLQGWNRDNLRIVTNDYSKSDISATFSQRGLQSLDPTFDEKENLATSLSSQYNTM